MAMMKTNGGDLMCVRVDDPVLGCREACHEALSCQQKARVAGNVGGWRGNRRKIK